jgi:hypothetical protein
MTAHCRRLFLLKHKKDKTHKKTTKKNQEKGKSLPSNFCFALSLLAFTFTLPFQVFFLGIFFSSSRGKKNTKKKKTIEKKKYAEKGGSLLSSSCSAFSLLALIFAFLFLHFCFKCFFLASSFSQIEEKKKHKEKKNHKEEKICKKRRELAFKLSLCLFTFGSHTYLPAFGLLFQAFSLSIFFFSKKRKKKNTKKKKTIEKEKKCREGRELTSKFHSALSFLAPTSALSF